MTIAASSLLLAFLAGLALGAVVAWSIGRARAAAALGRAEELRLRVQALDTETAALRERAARRGSRPCRGRDAQRRRRAARRGRAALRRRSARAAHRRVQGARRRRAVRLAARLPAARRREVQDAARRRVRRSRHAAPRHPGAGRPAAAGARRLPEGSARHRGAPAARSRRRSASSCATSPSPIRHCAPNQQAGAGAARAERPRTLGRDRAAPRRRARRHVDVLRFHRAGDGERREQPAAPRRDRRLPSERVVVIDAKVPLAAYLDAIEAGDEYARDQALGQAPQQVRSHVQRLAARGYATEIEQTAEFVVLFIPNDSFLAAGGRARRQPRRLGARPAGGARHAGDAVRAAPGRRGRLAPGTRRRGRAEDQRGRPRAVRAHGQPRRAPVAHGGPLGKTVKAYNQAVASLESRVLPTARKLESLGVGSRKPIESMQPIDQAVRQIVPQQLTLEP